MAPRSPTRRSRTSANSGAVHSEPAGTAIALFALARVGAGFVVAGFVVAGFVVAGLVVGGLVAAVLVVAGLVVAGLVPAGLAAADFVAVFVVAGFAADLLACGLPLLAALDLLVPDCRVAGFELDFAAVLAAACRVAFVTDDFAAVDFAVVVDFAGRLAGTVVVTEPAFFVGATEVAFVVAALAAPADFLAVAAVPASVVALRVRLEGLVATVEADAADE